MIKKLKRKKKQRSAVELHKVLPTLKLVEDKKQDKKEIKTISEQSQDELEPIISTPITNPVSDK
jgi:arsenate reductase-like glutaredoxin family protein